MEKHLKVSAIKDGTVIDHIPSHALFKVIKILKLEECAQMVTFGNNLDSQAMGTKAIVKISNRFFEEDEINRIALVAPNAKLNTIRDYQVVEKRVVETPGQITGIVNCFNPNCITNAEQITTRFEVISNKPIALKCHYCEKITNELEMVFA